ncbi:hypothetical protein [Streptomyces sp. TRM49041]|uniref:hypothetical protein n=1 Tax=Streptomyces sp. TRM49041 TaxID=2603216 RepID=UPI00292A487C|nr:hypothetical protein [Streptomyces sp. TRM49041]
MSEQTTTPDTVSTSPEAASGDVTPAPAAEAPAAPEATAPVDAPPAGPAAATPAPSADAAPGEAVPAPGEAVPAPGEAVPAGAVPTEAVPAEAVPADDAPAEAVPVDAPPAEDAPPAVSGRSGRGRRVAWAVARWTVAALVCGGLGAGAAYGIAGMERHEVPGLATEKDGRWEYPKLSLPALPAGVPRPFSDGNNGENHYADLRKLLLPAPAGATVDKKLAGGWVTVDQYLAEYDADKRPALKQALTDHAVRHIAARGWTMPDGTVTRVYLLQFNSGAFTRAFQDDDLGFGGSSGAALQGAADMENDPRWTLPEEMDTSSYVFRETEPYGPEQTRQGYVVAGDTLALVVQSKKGGTPEVPFHQTVVLQNQLLG